MSSNIYIPTEYFNLPYTGLTQQTKKSIKHLYLLCTKNTYNKFDYKNDILESLKKRRRHHQYVSKCCT